MIVKEGRPLKWIIYTVVGKQGCKANKVDTIENGELFTLFYIYIPTVLGGIRGQDSPPALAL